MQKYCILLQFHDIQRLNWFGNKYDLVLNLSGEDPLKNQKCIEQNLKTSMIFKDFSKIQSVGYGG